VGFRYRSSTAPAIGVRDSIAVINRAANCRRMSDNALTWFSFDVILLAVDWNGDDVSNKKQQFDALIRFS
jgi:hypothetical protein